jgi:hypothetical protein
MTAATSIGFIGLGVMGAAQSANLVRKSSRSVVVFDLDESKVAELVAAGAEAGTSVADVAARCDVIFMSLPSHRALSAVTQGADGLLPNARPGQVVVDMGTSPVPLVKQLADEFAAVGASYIDAPVARTRQAAIDGTLAIMVGASDSAIFEQVLPLLHCMGTDVTLCGPSGAGALVKVLNNLIVFETVSALAEALTIARASNLVPDDLLFEVLGGSSAGSFALEAMGKKNLVPDVHPEKAFSATYMLKDVTYALDWAAEVGVTTSMGATAQALLQATVDGGYADLYHTSVIKTVEAKAGAKPE